MQTVGTKNISFNQKIFSAHKILAEYEKIFYMRKYICYIVYFFIA